MTKVSRAAIVAVMAVGVAVPGLISAGVSGTQGELTAIERLVVIRESLRQSHAAKDGAAYLRNSVTMRDFVNGSPNSILQLMLAQLFAGKDDEAMQSFGQYVRMGQSNEELLGSKQFDTLRASPEYSRLHAEMIAN